MKIAEAENIILLDINNLAKYEIVADKLDDPIAECIANSEYTDRSVDDYKEILKFNVRHKDNKFKLIVGLDKEMDLVFFTSIAITKESGKPVCLVYLLYSKPRLMNKLVPTILPYIDEYMMKHHCNKMLFHTDIKNTNAFTRVGKKYNWKPMRTVFERNLDR